MRRAKAWWTLLLPLLDPKRMIDKLACSERAQDRADSARAAEGRRSVSTR